MVIDEQLPSAIGRSVHERGQRRAIRPGRGRGRQRQNSAAGRLVGATDNGGRYLGSRCVVKGEVRFVRLRAFAGSGQ